MERNKSGLFLVLIVFILMFVGFLWLFTDRMAGESISRRNSEGFDNLISKAEDYDMHIYWIGQTPEGLERLGEKLSVVSPSSVSADTMPIPWSDLHFTRYNEDGAVIEEIEPRDYAQYMLIVVADGADLTDEQYEVIRSCAVDNRVPVLLFGDSISPFRETMLLAPGRYEANDTLLYTYQRGVSSSPLNLREDDGKLPENYMASEILKFSYELFDTEVA